MTRARRLAIAVLVVLAVAVAGCSAITGGEASADVNTSNYDAATLTEDARSTMTGVESYTFDMSMDIESEGRMGTSSISMEAEGEANTQNRRVHYESLDMDVDAGLRSGSISTEAYLLGNTMYRREGGTWVSEPASQSSFGQSMTGASPELLADADVSIEGAERINGEDTLVVSVEPTQSALADFASSGVQSGQVRASQVSIESATVTNYIAAEEPHYVLRSEVTMEATIDGTPMTIDLSITMDDHGEEITIDVPDDVR